MSDLNTPSPEHHETHEQEIARKRAEFEAANEVIHAKHQQLEHEIAPMLNHLAEEAKEQMHDLHPETHVETAHLPESMIKKTHIPEYAPDMRAGKEYESPVPPAIRDGGTSPQHISKEELLDPNAPAMPVQSHSLRKDG